jgi:hypothetical protein
MHYCLPLVAFAIGALASHLLLRCSNRRTISEQLLLFVIEGEPLTQFVLATLEQNEPGAVYEGSVFDRWLTILHSSGKRLHIFDPSFPVNMSASLKVGQPYELVISPVVLGDLKVQNDNNEFNQGERYWQGKVLTLDWQFREESFSHAVSDLQSERWSLVETDLGTIALQPRKLHALGVRAEVGSSISWKEFRTDLLAVR